MTAQFNFTDLLRQVTSLVSNVNAQITSLENAPNGVMDLGNMFQLQFCMQTLSQFVEAASNVLTAANTEMITMARAVKGG
ncbi:hypothetical protein CLAVI_000283 [Candidatus Clavichlamydia salmonicola]|uniref:DUF5407 family protein n=1 Tax=Candidatus Clavichlamydia salmonicola TaxID=469812 RepID=UPI00189163D6|nr:DUF5407 family protein [Candidatus Clavichlamydia salmonicola]MBF5050668.1 hypothetical protein [Candidatus Clavichlamydia salmonicola]